MNTTALAMYRRWYLHRESFRLDLVKESFQSVTVKVQQKGLEIKNGPKAVAEI